MRVFRATTEQIEYINIDDFFTGHTLPKDKEGLHYYPCERYCEMFPEIMEDEKESDSEELKIARATFKDLEKVDFDTIELEEI